MDQSFTLIRKKNGNEGLLTTGFGSQKPREENANRPAKQMGTEKVKRTSFRSLSLFCFAGFSPPFARRHLCQHILFDFVGCTKSGRERQQSSERQTTSGIALPTVLRTAAHAYFRTPPHPFSAASFTFFFVFCFLCDGLVGRKNV